MRDYIINSVKYWAKEYHIDGFRFDLMGLLTVELMNRIRAELDAAFGPGEKLMYGEPWRAQESPMEPGSRPVLKNALALLHPDVGVFCDLTRDAIKGDAFIERAPGFVNGGEGREQDLREGGERILCLGRQQGGPVGCGRRRCGGADPDPKCLEFFER